MLKHETFKVAVVGLGRVGVTCAYALLLKGLVSDLVLYSREIKKAEGEKADFEHGMPFLPHASVTATDRFEDLEGTDLVIFTAGCAQKPGQTRLDLTKTNCAIVDAVIPKIVKHAPHTLILMVANPLDIMTYRAAVVAKLPTGRVFGSGTLLDTARFRTHLGKAVDVNPTSIHAYVLGEHGDSSFAPISTATIGGKPLLSFDSMTKEHVDWALEQARKDAYNVIAEKGATYYGIASVVARIVQAVSRDEQKIMPLSSPLSGQYGLENVALSLPSVVGRNGIHEIINLPLALDELESLRTSAEVIHSHLDEV